MGDPATREAILVQVDAIVRHCEEQTRPLEIDPARCELFELFAKAYCAGFLTEDEDGNAELSADALCRELGLRWGLKDAAASSVRDQAKLPQEQLARLRSLWSLLRMWMEWSYAWDRWSEFHDCSSQARSQSAETGFSENKRQES